MSNVQLLEDATLKLLCVDGLGCNTLRAISKKAGGITEAANAVLSGEMEKLFPKGSLRAIREQMVRMEVDASRWSADAAEASLVTVMDDEFPQFLFPLPACPAVLWYKGDLNVLRLPSIAVVGSRRCSQYGLEQAKDFSSEFAKNGIVVVSGGARGIDAAAHRSAMQHNGITSAVLGSGLSVTYPPEHGQLFNEIVSNGGVLLSEFPCQRPPRPAYFPRRNRIVSGLSSAVLVIEAAKRSGALITARIAVEEHGRQGYAVPGRNGDVASAGCLQCIRDGWLEVAIEPSRIVEEAKESWGRLMK